MSKEKHIEGIRVVRKVYSSYLNKWTDKGVTFFIGKFPIAYIRQPLFSQTEFHLHLLCEFYDWDTYYRIPTESTTWLSQDVIEASIRIIRTKLSKQCLYMIECMKEEWDFSEIRENDWKYAR